MQKEELLKFIALAHQNTYAAPKEIQLQNKCETSISLGHKDYEFIKDDFRYHDSYAGSTWAPGKEIVFLKEVPYWSMAYQGRHNENLEEDFFQEKAFPFLKQALMAFDKEMPFRGPSLFVDGDFKYIFEIDGNYEYFTGQERIFYKDKSVFFQDVMGSLIK